MSERESEVVGNEIVKEGKLSLFGGLADHSKEPGFCADFIGMIWVGFHSLSSPGELVVTA